MILPPDFFAEIDYLLERVKYFGDTFNPVALEKALNGLRASLLFEVEALEAVIEDERQSSARDQVQAGKAAMFDVVVKELDSFEERVLARKTMTPKEDIMRELDGIISRLVSFEREG